MSSLNSAWGVNTWVQDVAETPVSKFYPTAVAKATDLPLDEVFSHLLSLVDNGTLSMKWQVICPRCFTTLETYDRFPDFEHTLYCNCGNQIEEVSIDMVFPIFEFNNDYKKYIKEKKKKPIQSRISLRSSKK